MNKKVRIITDSGSDLTPSILDGRDIEILKMPVTADGVVYEVNNEEDLMNIYRLMRQGVVFKTAHVPYFEILSAFRRCAEDGVPCIFVGLSSALTSQHQAATMAAKEVAEEFPDAVIYLIDSASATMGYGRAVLIGYDKAMQGADAQEVLNTIIAELNCTEHLFSVGTLEYLVRGGRLSKVAGAVGDALSIRPVLNIDDEGKLYTMEKVRGDKKLRNRLAQIAEEALNTIKDQEIYMTEGDNSEYTAALIEAVNKYAQPKAIHVFKMGPVIGVHTGPEVTGLIYRNPDRNKNIKAVCVCGESYVKEATVDESCCVNRAW
ncbi:MAG: DegV family protein [Anaerofustis stercorihominis]|nr:DegV family protein [Anaerofustis stercorihominis]